MMVRALVSGVKLTSPIEPGAPVRLASKRRIMMKSSETQFPTFEEWFASRPQTFLYGAEGDGGDGGDGGSGDAGDGGGDAGDGTGQPAGGGGGGDDDSFVRMPKQEADALRREVAETRRAKQQAEREAKAERERIAAEQGRYEEIAEERAREIEEAQARAEAAEYQLEQFQRDLRVQRLATTLGFKDPGDAIRFLDDDDTGDDASAERALKKLAEQKDYLVEKRRPSGAAMNGGSKGLTLDDIKNMSQDEINANWEAVQATMAQQG